ncbi:MAG TPA: amylo-alpha-1,6-glucosidase [Thermoanaerobaculia bacterium]|jgi:predicted glycogen debranching enzyme|nr:amylo-alpha-1,6-glucosidase [Thermoanaerobaculia bacterium]
MDDALTREWLEPDGLGGFASGTCAGIRTRRYHALLLTAKTPPTGRVVLVNGFDAFVRTPTGRYAISSQAYGPDVTSPDGASRITAFEIEPWPRWTFTLPDGTTLAQEIFVPKGSSSVAVSWRRLLGAGAVELEVRPFFSGRDFHGLQHENPSFRFDAEATAPGVLRFQPYGDVPAVFVRTNGAYAPEPEWYRNFLYGAEKARGLDFSEDLASPGTFRFDLAAGEGVWLAAAQGHESALGQGGAEAALESLRLSERSRRARFDDRLDRAADAYLVRRGDGLTVVAGYPWFTDWGRDTFIALRGLCLATGRLAEAEGILLEWAAAVSEGMLPNFFPDEGSEPEFNSVDASLWYVVAVYDYFEAMAAAGLPASPPKVRILQAAIEAILAGYSGGTRYGIRADADGLLAAGQAGVQLTWMDAKIGDWVVTPRIGKPVEVQALWLNALWIGSVFSDRWRELHDRGLAAFHERFWNEDGGCLYDVVDPGHVAGAADATFRPNQIFAVGGLPFPILAGERARRVVDAVEARLATPVGLRSLCPEDPAYVGRYEGGPRERDGAYHQGTVWPYLAGAFVDAWVRVRGGTTEATAEARDRFLAPLLAHLDAAGLGHVSEIADGDAPHTPGGCPFQAWSLGELLRIDRLFLATAGSPGDRRAGKG